MFNEKPTYLSARDNSHRAAHDPAVYRRAAEIIRTKGMVKGSFAAIDPNDPNTGVDITNPAATCYCIMGALTLAGLELGHFKVNAENHPYYADRTDADTYGFWMVPYATPVMELPMSANSWNNRAATTTEDVIAALERGAENLESRG
ncbi:hypothetical protein KIKIMORA_01500 [Brevundimonas phage vB_BpoS-Kikimora]|uniref:Uncharacterized protein n=1 Tax=Brevundimonas phage vB_BpoS-Kikimora TaxID=2948601 RepID=A0A9E7SL04_9CAUD|nr:hypothetical protein KIKIMORA_01500 [Brevundimonas phage vB_BpoS-Kikimora]